MRYLSQTAVIVNLPNYSNGSTKPSILLVEDDLIVQKVHTKMLERLGYQVEIASTGRQAISLASKRYAAILMDIGLPDIDGITVSATIRQQNLSHSLTPIIALTAYGNDVKNECLSAGMNEVATKPIKPEELSNILSKWIKMQVCYY